MMDHGENLEVKGKSSLVPWLPPATGDGSDITWPCQGPLRPASSHLLLASCAPQTSFILSHCHPSHQPLSWPSHAKTLTSSQRASGPFSQIALPPPTPAIPTLLPTLTFLAQHLLQRMSLTTTKIAEHCSLPVGRSMGTLLNYLHFVFFHWVFVIFISTWCNEKSKGCEITNIQMNIVP